MCIIVNYSTLMIYDAKLLHQTCVEEIRMNVCKHQGLYKHKDISNGLIGECHSFSYFNFENIKTTYHSSTKICYYRKDKHKQNIQKVKKKSKQHRNFLTYNISSSIICNKIGIVAECPLFE